MRQPTDSQWEAVRATGEHVLVEAGAGTGKTFTVVTRILYLLGVEVRGERHPAPVSLKDIVAITFTRQAAADLKRDLRAALRQAGRRGDAHAVDQARIGTIHGFCSDLMHEHALRCGRAPLRGVLEEGEALAWSEGSVRDELLAALERGDIAGLDALLGKWDTAKVESWTLRLMNADVLPHLDEADHSPEECALIALARRSRARIEARLAAEGTIDYDRMIAWTRDLLRDEPGVRALLQRRIHTLIIDEFQDTDSTQREIAYLLAEPMSGRTDTPRLMLVGDPKQSIYRFRGADVTVWSGVRRDFEETGCGRRLRLVDNFRSVPDILALVETTAGVWLNKSVTDGDLADYEVAFENVQPHRTAVQDHAIEFVVVAADDDGKLSADSRREIEAAAVARRLVTLNQAGTRWRDMALLLRSWGSSDIYARAFRAAGIPAYALRDDDFLETREVLDLIVALQAIRDPHDDLALFGFLRSPFANVPDDALLAVAVNARRPYAKHLPALLDGSGDVQLPGRDAVADALALLLDLAGLRDRIPAAALLDELLHRTGYMAHLALMGERGAQAALNVRRFLHMISLMEESSAGMVLRAIADRRERKDRIPQARLHGEQDDVVLITSIHMAKGLDWPVVIYGDLGAGEWNDGERLLIGRNAIRLGEPDCKPDEQSPEWQMLRALIGFEEAAEEKRVVYVGLTRPKDLLILAGLPQVKGRASVARDLTDRFPALESTADGAVLDVVANDGVVRRALVHVARGDMIREAAADTVDVAALREAAAQLALPRDPIPSPIGLVRHSATELLAFERCERRHMFKYVHGIREPRFEAAASGTNAITRGQIVHDVLEHIEEEMELEGLLEDAIGRWDESAPPPDSALGHTYRTELSEEISRVLALPEYASLVAAPGARRELQFLHVMPDGTAMQGAIDLAAPVHDSITFVDVKTSNVDAAAAPKKAAEYAVQQDVYVAAGDAISPRAVAGFGFVFSRPATAVMTTLTAAQREDAAERVAALTARMANAPGAYASNPRECFMCGYRRVRLCAGVPAPGAPPTTPQDEALT